MQEIGQNLTRGQCSEDEGLSGHLEEHRDGLHELVRIKLVKSNEFIGKEM